VLDSFSHAMSNAIVFDTNITNMANLVVPDGSYSDLISLSIRQVLSNIELTIGKGEDGTFNASDTMLFMRDVDGVDGRKK
jgi:hypothetical protein